MFRPMRRFKQQISDEECVKVLTDEPRGVLAVLGDGGYPYTVPMDFYYEDGCIYFHAAKEGHKIDAIAKCDKVSFCVMDKGYKNEGEWALNIKSVVAFGRISIIEDEKEAEEKVRRFAQRYTNDLEYIERDIEKNMHRANILCLKIEHMTGKLVNES